MLVYRVVQKTVPQFYFCDNFRKCTPIFTIFSLLEQEIHAAYKQDYDFHLPCIM